MPGGVHNPPPHVPGLNEAMSPHRQLRGHGYGHGQEQEQEQRHAEAEEHQSGETGPVTGKKPPRERPLSSDSAIPYSIHSHPEQGQGQGQGQRQGQAEHEHDDFAFAPEIINTAEVEWAGDAVRPLSTDATQGSRGNRQSLRDKERERDIISHQVSTRARVGVGVGVCV